MNQTAFSRPTVSAIPIAWRAAEYAAQRLNAQDTCDDRVRENIFDVEEERTAVDIFVSRRSYASYRVMRCATAFKMRVKGNQPRKDDGKGNSFHDKT